MNLLKPLFAKRDSTKSIGEQHEALAARHLAAHKLKMLCSNYRCRMGEIDLIALDGNTLCFVEVRYRKNRDFGGAANSVGAKKQQKIILTAQHFLQQEPQYQTSSCRFDVIAIDGQEINWIKDAFQL